jgi:hypothetical protein
MTQQPAANGELEPKDPFSIDIALTHPTCDPQRITRELCSQPTYCWRQGDRFGGLVKRSTYWYGRLVSGSTPDEFDGALRKVASFLTKAEPFFAEFKQGDGKVELILNHRVEQIEGKVLEVYIDPSFLSQLGAIDIGFRVQGWIGSPGHARR